MAEVVCKVLNDSSSTAKSLYLDKTGRYYVTRLAEDGKEYNCYSSSKDWIEDLGKYYIICEGRNGKTYKYYSVDKEPVKLNRKGERKEDKGEKGEKKRTVSKLLSVGRNLNVRKEFILSFSCSDPVNSSMYIGIGTYNTKFTPIASLIPKNAKLNSYIVMIKESEKKSDGPEIALSVGHPSKEVVDIGTLKFSDTSNAVARDTSSDATSKGIIFDPSIDVSALDLIALHVISLGEWKNCYICGVATFSYV